MIHKRNEPFSCRMIEISTLLSNGKDDQPLPGFDFIKKVGNNITLTEF